MYGKLVHRPPFGHHCHAPRPPFGEPREVGERYLGHPELTDYWIKPYLLEALKHYPRLDDECVVEGLWKFANTICLQNKHTSIRTPPTYDDPVTTHKIAFLDKDDIELGCIKFWRKVDSTFGIDMILNGRGISITGNNDDPTLCLVDTPIGDNKKQIVNIEYLEFSLSALQGLVDGLTDRIGALEDYKGQADSLIRDPNGNFRTVHTAIHNDSDDQNIPTCYAVYQYGKGISEALNARIDNSSVVDSVQDGNMHPVTSSAVADALNELSSRISSIANDVANLNNSGGGSSGGSGSGSNDSYIFAYPSGTVKNGVISISKIINVGDIVTGDYLASAVAVSKFTTGDQLSIVTYTIDQNSSLDSNSFNAAYLGNGATYNPTNLSSSDSYRCIVAPEVTQGTHAGGDYNRLWINVKAGLFQRIGGSGSDSGGVVDVGVFGNTILGGFVGSTSQTPGIYTGTVGSEYDISELFQNAGGTGSHAFATYPAGTKFECIVASSAEKETEGNDVYTNVTNGAFKLKSLGVGGGAIRYLLKGSAPSVGSTVTSDGDRYISDSYTVWLEDVNIIGRNASTDNIQVSVRSGYVLPANTSYVVDSILATYEHPAEGDSNSPGWAGGLCYKCLIHIPD